jgi:hypothetical protein
MTTVEDITALYDRWLTRLWHGDFDAADVVTEGFVGHWPEQEVTGRAALVELIRATHQMFDSLTFELTLGPISQADLVAARWVGTGIQGERKQRLLGNDLLRLEGHRFAEYWVASWIGD